MPKLAATKVKNVRQPGRYSDGESLYLLVRMQGGKLAEPDKVAMPPKLTKSWVFRWRDRGTGKLRDMGLGAYPAVSLQAAREGALTARAHVVAGKDPKAERERVRAELLAQQGKVQTFDECVTQYIAAHEAGWKNAKHVAQWRSTLKAISPVGSASPAFSCSSAAPSTCSPST